ncbi:uncharacterized protein LOC107995038 [Apis cerana]|uniref:uncharacterized protein LOC107995038 n=1 Tax=Apis cerana TaxID=7461 RepID=UPI0007E2B4CB|nr:uncharacterized protein LOC107995038 [Apis cerana]
MFIYLIAPVAILFFIFGLLHIKCLYNWLLASLRCSLTLYNGLICRPAIQTSLNEDFESNLTIERPMAVISDKAEYEDLLAQSLTISNNERLSDIHLGETGSKSRNVNLPRYSFEDIISEKKDKDLGLPVMRTLQLGLMQDDTIRTTKQEGKESIFETLKNSIEKSNYSSPRLNTRQIYNMILKETLKESEARQKLLDNDKFNEVSPIEIKEHLPSSSENKPELENNINK